MESAQQLNSTAASLLGFLYEGPLSGWELVQTAQRKIGGFWSLTPSQVYRELNAMAAAGLLRAGTRGLRERRPFAITEAGRQAFRAWLAAGPADETIRMPMLLTLLFGEHLPPERLAAILRHQRAMHAARLAAYEAGNTSAERAGRSVYQQAAVDFGINHERAVLAWFDRLPRGLRGA